MRVQRLLSRRLSLIALSSICWWSAATTLPLPSRAVSLQLSCLQGYSSPELHTKMSCCADAPHSPATRTAPGQEADDMEWAQSDDDGADDEATLDAEEQEAAAEGLDVKVCPAMSLASVDPLLVL